MVLIILTVNDALMWHVLVKKKLLGCYAVIGGKVRMTRKWL